MPANRQKTQLLAFSKRLYHIEPDAPFCGDIDDVVLRHPESRKWFALFMVVSPKAVGKSSLEPIHLLNLRVDPAEQEKLIDGVHYFPGYHMNHRLWISIVLDDALELRKSEELMKKSYSLTLAKRNKAKK